MLFFQEADNHKRIDQLANLLHATLQKNKALEEQVRRNGSKCEINANNIFTHQGFFEKISTTLDDYEIRIKATEEKLEANHKQKAKIHSNNIYKPINTNLF